MYDILVKNGRVLDGSGNPWFEADIALVDGKIAAVQRGIDAASARETIDAGGQVVCPGFIDTHTHSDFTLLADPLAQSKVQQGVTTEVVGNCGGWLAPVLEKARSGIEHGVRHKNVSLDWTSVGGYLARLGKQGVALNVCPLIGFGNVRASIMGYTEEPATPGQVTEMQQLVRENMSEGAFGMSTGLFYAPQSYASQREVTAVVKALSPSGGLYVTHIRDEGNYGIGLAAALREAFETAREAGVPLHISHLQANGIAAWGSAGWMVEAIENERAQGLDVTADVYPYIRCGGGISGSVMPRWALEGGRDRVVSRLQDPTTRKRIAREIAATFERRGGPELHTFSSYAPRTEFEGMTLAQVAGILGESPEYAVLTLLEEGEASWVSAILNEDDVSEIMKADWVMVGSDGSALAPAGPVSGGKPHPRNYGTFPRVLRLYTREKRLFSVEEAVRKMTSLPAQRFRLAGRGLIKEGFWGDVVVFDPETIRDTATFEDPHLFPTGISYVLVNGEMVVSHGTQTGLLAGSPLTCP
ncbi:MAG: D-aminoacylase [Bacillota bacterium]|nr:D-aminoacylase [Bacillota bacterium]